MRHYVVEALWMDGPPHLCLSRFIGRGGFINKQLVAMMDIEFEKHAEVIVYSTKRKLIGLFIQCPIPPVVGDMAT